jgi:hypothetical protein
VIVANVAAIPGSPTNNQGVQVSNTTGLESFTPLSGIPVGFVGSAALYARIRYSTGTSSWVWVEYAANDPEGRYLAKTGGTMTGALTFAGAQPTATTSAANIVQLTNSVSSTSVTTAATPASVKTANDAAVAAQSTANTANTTANAALPKAGGTMTGALVNPLGSAAAPSLTFTGDTNTGIYSPGADQVAISTNGVARLTTSTTAVSSSLAIDHPLGAVGTPSITFTGDLNTGFYSPAADTLAAVTAGANRLHITSGGLVGLGTSSPWSLMSVGGTGTAGDVTSARQISVGNGSSYGASLGYYQTGSSAPFAGVLQALDGGAGTRLLLNPSGGNVGIGTTSPAVTLDVSATDAIRVAAGTTGQRPTGAAGMIRYNSTLGQFEGYGAAWGTIGGGAKGGGSDDIFYENGQTVTTNYTLTTNKNAMTAGPVAINSGVTVTVPSGSSWTIV